VQAGLVAIDRTPRPIIALTAYVEPARWGPWDLLAVTLPFVYVESLRRAGARVIVTPPDPTDASVLNGVDGLVIVGGADLDPTLYGAAPHETTDTPRTERDSWELRAYRRAREEDLPVLGICRGLQIMAVAHGGSLHQDLPSLLGTRLHRDEPGTFKEHRVRFAPGSLIASIVGNELEVKSSHHQAVAEPGTLKVTGWAEDGTVEACEDPSARFVLGVQWHPETSDDPRLFAAFVDACRP
jgi:putative glutamine amidotransferase